MAVGPQRAAEVLAKCARRCCICRRFRPLHLQVHHVVEQCDGGTDDLDNLIAICVSCHADVHTDTKLTRRFTIKELRLHRDNVYDLVRDGKLPAGTESPELIDALSASIVRAIADLGVQVAGPLPRPQLPAEAIDILLAATRGSTPINVVRSDGGGAILAGGRTFGGPADLRAAARYTNAVRHLQSHQLVEGSGRVLYVTEAGWRLADDMLSAGVAQS